MNRHRRWVSDPICRVLVTGLPLLPAVATIVMGIVIGGAVYGGYLWTGIKKTNPLPHTAEAHQVGAVTAEVTSHGSRTVRMSWISGSVFSRVRVRFIDVLPFTWSSALPATGASNFTVAGSNLTVNYEVQGCSPTNFSNGICSLWHSHVATGSVTFLAPPNITHWNVTPRGTVTLTEDIRFSYTATNSTNIIITRDNVSYIPVADDDGDLTIETGSSPHIRQMPLGIHTFRLTAYRVISSTSELLVTEAPGVFVLTVPTPTPLPTSIVDAPVVPAPGDLSVTCTTTGTTSSVTATWNAPSDIPPEVTQQDYYEYVWATT